MTASCFHNIAVWLCFGVLILYNRISKSVNIFQICLHINQDTSKCDINFKISTDVEQYLLWKCLWVLLKNQVRICETVHRYEIQIKPSGSS